MRIAAVLLALLFALLLHTGCRSRRCCPRVCARPDAAPVAEPVARAPAWVTAFDGKSLAGWVTVGGRYDGKAIWRVEDGAIVGREGEHHAGGLLYTEREYRDVEIELDAWITYPFDSGVFLRMRPEAKGAQVTLDYRPGGEIAGIYSEGWWFHNPAAKNAWKRDEWNRVKVRCAGEPMHIQAWLNGSLVTDYRFPEDAAGFASKGRIGLQVHGGRNDPPDAKVKFRRIRIREL